MHVVRTDESHWRTLKEVRLQSLRDAPLAFGLSYAEVAQYSDAQWKDRAAGRTPPAYFLAFNDDQCIGIGGGVASNSEFQVVAMWVAPPCRKSTVARKLLDAIMALAVSQGWEQINLLVSPSNAPAVRLYQSVGFQFKDHYEPLESHPEISVQKMVAHVSKNSHLQTSS